jgi:hypothetical protein
LQAVLFGTSLLDCKDLISREDVLRKEILGPVVVCDNSEIVGDCLERHRFVLILDPKLS